MKPRIFIGSSVEGKDIAAAIQVGLHHDARCVIWDQAFPLSSNTIDGLFENSIDSDFAIFVFSPDDKQTIRGVLYETARDNVLFEAGFFMGMHGKGRVFIVIPQGSSSFHMPSDLLGFTVATYDPDFAKTHVNGALGTAVTLVRQAIAASSWAKRRIDIKAYASIMEGANWPLKLNLRIKNSEPVPVQIQSNEFEFRSAAQRATNAELHRDIYKPKFKTSQVEKTDVYESHCLLLPDKSIEAWVPFDPTMGLDKLKSLANLKQTGIWRFRCVWLDKAPVVQIYEEKL